MLIIDDEKNILRDAEYVIHEVIPNASITTATDLSKVREDLVEDVDIAFLDILVTQEGNYAVDASLISCDYYDYLDKKRPWQDEFMTQYTNWTEYIIANEYFAESGKDE